MFTNQVGGRGLLGRGRLDVSSCQKLNITNEKFKHLPCVCVGLSFSNGKRKEKKKQKQDLHTHTTNEIEEKEREKPFFSIF